MVGATAYAAPPQPVSLRLADLGRGPQARRGVGLAADQRVRRHHMLRCFRRAVALRADQAHQRLHGFFRHVGNWLAHGGQLRPDGGGERRVVKAGHGQVARHVQAQAVGDGHHGGRHVVVAGEDGGRPLFKAQQRLRRVQAGTVGEQALHDQLRRALHVLLGDGGLEPGQAARAGALVRVADDEADALVAQ
ncbi:conserved hypothetical protein [Ricinus communis]|uniref:Uncharacterized protein n=1 Tax=Ricinus communis TaxID=3988 RepID=B9TCS3_RICCO|nr:conserved hypothetical protein [Ricinus communis]